MKTAGFVAIILWSLLSMGQEVHVTQGKGAVELSVSAQKPYQLMSSEAKTPVLSVDCAQKGKKSAHLLKFLPESSVSEDGSDVATGNTQQVFDITIGGVTQVTPWIQTGDAITYSYFAKTDADRVKFIESLLRAGTVSIEFKSFLTGATTTSTFDLSKLREEINNHPECAMK